MNLPYTKNCFVCGAHNAHGLHLRFRWEGNEVLADFTPAAHHAGFRDIIHGGIISTALDEAMFWGAACATKRFCLAVELNVRFSRKVAVGEKYLIIAKLDADRGRVWESSAELRDAAGKVCARGTCKQMPIDAAAMRHAAVDFLPDPATAAATAVFPGFDGLSYTTSVNTDEQTKLLGWARRAIEQAVREEKSTPVTELTDNLCAPHAAFVTLKKRGELRGCIGQMDFARPLWENVIGAAVGSALEDSRFPPVRPEELPEVRLEISVLEPPVDLLRVEDFDADRYGIIVQRGIRRALLLPKVAQEYGWSAEQVLECVCQKAGLPADAWRDPEMKFQVFTAFDFGEAEADD